MSWITELLRDELKKGHLVCEGRLTYLDQVLYDDIGEGDALSKELAIEAGFNTEVNEFGGRTHKYVEELIKEWRHSDDEYKRLTAPVLPRYFVLEDELNNPPKGSQLWELMNKNRAMAFFVSTIGGKMNIMQDLTGRAIKNHVYFLLTKGIEQQQFDNFEDDIKETIRKSYEHTRENAIRAEQATD